MLGISGSQSFGVMFHHFWGKNHPQGQGAITADQFASLLEWLKRNYIIISPDEFLAQNNRKSLEDNQICLSFDDSLLSQYEIAVPVLNSMNLKGIFNVYSSAFSGNPSPLEIFRYFRTVAFKSVDDFYEIFFENLSKLEPDLYKSGIKNLESDSNYLAQYSIYTKEDRQFRYFRDLVLGEDRYVSAMELLMSQMKFDASSIPEKVFMKREHLIKLKSLGHEIGLHSDTHPTNIASLSRKHQETEYITNYDFLVRSIGVKPSSVAYPCGSYNSDTIEIMKDLDVRSGFLANLQNSELDSKYEIPRVDHMNLMKVAQIK